MYIAMFSGFNPVLPILILVPGVILALIVAYFSYNTLDKAGPLKKWSLILLRSSSLLILLTLLLNPFLVNERIESNEPKIAIYLDNSQSTAVEKGEYEGLQQYEDLIEELGAELDDRAEYVDYIFGNQVESSSEIDGSDTETRLDNVLIHLLENEYQYSAAILFSDGIITGGRNPIFSSAELSIPLITVPLGDTTAVRDIAVSDVNYSSPIYTNTSNQISADIQHQQTEGERTEVRLIQDGEVVDSETINFQSASGSQLIEFTREYDDPGFYNLTIEAVPVDDEFSDENNRYSFSLEVLDDKTRILSLAFGVHPDVAAIRNHISTDIQNELLQSNWLGGDRFSGIDILEPNEDTDKIDLVILHGLPPSDSEIENRVEELISDSPVLFFTMPGSAASQSLQEIKPFSAENVESVLDVRPVQISDERSHSLLELDIPAERTLPALRAYSANYSLSPAAENLLGLNFQGSPTDIPFLIADESLNKRIAAVNAFGWHRYKINRQESVQSFFETFMTNLVSWTSTSPGDRNLTLTPVKNQFTENENVQIRATLTNEFGEPETNGIIRLELNDYEQAEETRSYRMTHSGTGNYSADLGQLPEGIYQVVGEAEVGSRTIGTDETRVIVGRSSIELVNTQRDDALLNGLAENSGGIFLNDHNFSRINAFLDENDLLEAEEDQVTENSYIRDFELVWFFIVLGLLTAEWLIRRSLSLV